MDCSLKFPVRTILFFTAILLITFVGYLAKTDRKLSDFIPIYNPIQLDTIITAHIAKHPEEIGDALNLLKLKKLEEQKTKMQQIFNAPANESPIAGNQSGDVAVTMFFDYRCGYCKKASSTIQKLLETDPNVKIVFKELPILGVDSAKLSKLALEVYFTEPSRYFDCHNGFMALNRIDDIDIDIVLTKLKLDPEKIRKYPNLTAINKELTEVANLANSINLGGTPVFIIDGEVLPGAVDLSELTDKIKKARAKKK